ncbi:hypothetical protein LCGC14_2601160 [marine sediment metagenome]|uniref:Glycosyl transferase family 1 domain-containing protein n=1 Tax=marine sediment metagenome TaxID=412755 RepID=A0A0F9CJP4_9ZZZZ
MSLEFVKFLQEEGQVEKSPFMSWLKEEDKKTPFQRYIASQQELKEAEVFVLLSDYESQGIVVTEAISIGKPVMVNDSTALHDHVGNYGVVGITDVEHYGEITWKLKEMLDKPWKFVPKNNSVISQKETNTRTMEVYEMVKLYEGHE